MINKLTKLEQEINSIVSRNKKVEANKGWETSKTRIGFILLLTYIFAALVLYIIGVKDFYLGAIIPTLGFLLSTLSLPFIKKLWIKKNLQKK